MNFVPLTFLEIDIRSLKDLASFKVHMSISRHVRDIKLEARSRGPTASVYPRIAPWFFKSSRPKVMRGNESSHMTSYLLWVVIMCLGSTVLRIQLFEYILTWIWPSGSYKVKGHEWKWKFIYDFLPVVNSIYVAGKHCFDDTAIWKYLDLDLTFSGQSRSKVMRANESSYMTTHLLSIVTMRLGSTVLKTQLFENIFSFIWPLKIIQGHSS